MAFGQLLYGIFAGNGMSAEVAGPVGIAAMTGQVAHMGFVYLLQFTVMLSVNLAIINAFPFPALDGGRLFFLMIGKNQRFAGQKNLKRLCIILVLHF